MQESLYMKPFSIHDSRDFFLSVVDPLNLIPTNFKKNCEPPNSIPAKFNKNVKIGRPPN